MSRRRHKTQFIINIQQYSGLVEAAQEERGVEDKKLSQSPHQFINGQTRVQAQLPRGVRTTPHHRTPKTRNPPEVESM